MGRASSLLLRIGIAFAFIYAAVAAFLEPMAWSGYLPSFATQVVPAPLLLQIFSAVEIILAAWLLWGKWLRWSAGIAALMLAAIVVMNFWAIDIVFRDISIFFAALALSFADREP